MTVNLYKPEVGKVVDLAEGTFRIVKVGPSMDCLPGGRNIAPATLEPYRKPVDRSGTAYGHMPRD